MSDVSDIEARGQRQHDLDALSGDEGSDSYDTRAQRYSSDEESEDDDNDDELRREGFLVDDDDEEESETESEKRRRRRRKKKRRHQAEQAAAREELLDEEDLALVAENTYGVREAQPRLKRLKRGRRAVDEDEDEPRAEAGRAGGGSFGSDEFGSDEFEDGGFGADAFAGGEFEGDYRAERRGGREGGALDEYDSGGAAAAQGARHERTGAMASFLAEGLESIDDETWMELQDIFGSGEEYAFAMEAPAAAAAAGERTLAEVFEPAELEAKMMTQRDEEIRATDIPERMQMRAAAGEALRPLSEEEIEEETTWVMRQLHARQGRGEDEGFRQADFGNERFLAAVLSVLKLLSQEFYEVPFIAQHRREAFVTAEGAAEGEEAPTREWLSGEDLWRLYDYDQQFRGFLAARRRVQNTVRRLRGEGGAARAISSEDEAYAGELLATAGGVEEVADVGEWLQARYGEAMRGSAYARAGGAGFWAQARRTGAAAFAGRFGITARQVGDNVSAPGRHA
ncbi:Transcription elongation factor spt6, partial [Coemansia sp. RSA 2610]